MTPMSGNERLDYLINQLQTQQASPVIQMEAAETLLALADRLRRVEDVVKMLQRQMEGVRKARPDLNIPDLGTLFPPT